MSFSHWPLSIFSLLDIHESIFSHGIVDTLIHGFDSLPIESKTQTLQQLAGLHPLGRLGRAEDVAHGIWSLCAPGSDWLTGAILAVDGGINLV